MNKTKRRIFNTAIKVFSDKGYDNASIEEITAIAESHGYIQESHRV